MQAIFTSSLDNGELWLQVEEAHNIVQSCNKFLQAYSSRLAAELLDEASILLSKHIKEVISACVLHPHLLLVFPLSSFSVSTSSCCSKHDATFVMQALATTFADMQLLEVSRWVDQGYSKPWHIHNLICTKLTKPQLCMQKVITLT